jgi:hypothetical protein
MSHTLPQVTPVSGTLHSRELQCADVALTANGSMKVIFIMYKVGELNSVSKIYMASAKTILEPISCITFCNIEYNG